MTDEQAMWRVQMHDDTQAFAELVRRWELPLRRLATRLLGDVHRAEDLTQEAFARIFARRRDFDPAARFSTWVWRIAVNLCRDELRRRERRREIAWAGDEAGEDVPSPSPANGQTPAEAAATNERAEAVRRALLRLPEPYRLVVALRHYEGLRFHEVAQVLGIPEGTVKSRMAEALDRLQTDLRPWAIPESTTETGPGNTAPRPAERPDAQPPKTRAD
jgi:RNA polymerase sigma-70 factor (ECF subfamily)